MTAATEYVWSKSIGRYWILKLEIVPTIFLVLAIAAATVWAFAPQPAGGIGSYVAGASVATSFLVAMIQHFLFYRAIRCPRCGHNPNRYKNGKNLPTKTAWKNLASMTECPACGAT